MAPPTSTLGLPLSTPMVVSFSAVCLPGLQVLMVVPLLVVAFCTVSLPPMVLTLPPTVTPSLVATVAGG